MHSVTLNSGVIMPTIGFGVFQIPTDQTQKAVETAIEHGYRSFDTAAAYENESAVGAAIDASGVPREQLFITTKLWVQDAGEQAARKAFDRSLGRLCLDYLDLYLIHQPFGDYYGSWRAMEQLNQEGLVKAIGVSNFHQDRLVDLILHNDIVPAVNQIETHVFYQRADDQAVMKEYGVQHESWGPLAEGGRGFFENPVLQEVAAEQSRSVAQVALRWLVQRGIVIIPKSGRPERMVENLSLFDFELSADQMTKIAGLDTGRSDFPSHRDAEGAKMRGTRRFHT